MKKRLAFALTALLVLALFGESVLAQVPGQVPLNPRQIPQFVDPLPHFAGARVNAKSGGNLTVKMVPHKQIAVSTGTKLATGTVGPLAPDAGVANFWAYQISTDGTNFTDPLWPAYTIEAQRDLTGATALNVTYQNELGNQRYADVNLVVDQTLHSALPMLPFTNLNAYTGPVPTTVHLHGGEVPPGSDGGPDSWFDAAGNTGHAYNPNPYLYPNTQEGATLWYHDHALGLTRLNVYAGLAGFYLLREINEDALHLPGWSGDGDVEEVNPVTGAVTTDTPYKPEIEIVIQDRMFDTKGGLYMPSVGLNPEHPFWVPEFVGDVITVNGKTWPYLSVAPRTYRFRLLNGSNARFYNLTFPKGGPQITQIGTDGGFLDAPVPLGNGPLLLAPGERADVIIDFAAFAPVITKKGMKVSSFILGNDARTPFPGGAVVSGNTTGRIMQFVVNGNMTGTAAALPTSLRPTPLVKLTDFGNPAATLAPVAKTRQLTLNEVMGMGGPMEILVNNTKWSGWQPGSTVPRPDFTAVSNGTGSDPMMDFTYYSETMDEGTTEVWQIINLTADAHPIHLHLVQFQLMSRQPFDVKGYNAAYNAAFPGGLYLGAYGPPNTYTAPNGDGAIGGNPAVGPFLLPPARPALLNENGWKDTFIMYPGEVTTVSARWAPTDKAAGLDPAVAQNQMWFGFNPNGGHGYVWHCHIIDHEDNEMMRPYNVKPNPIGPWAPVPSVAVRAESADAESANDNPAEQPVSFALSQNYPNPFNPTTEIRFSLPENSHVRLTVFNSIGQEVKTLIDQAAPAGLHSVRLDASNLASGTYFYRIQAGGFVSTKKMILMK
jgi:spore coat protein A